MSDHEFKPFAIRTDLRPDGDLSVRGYYLAVLAPGVGEIARSDFTLNPYVARGYVWEFLDGLFHALARHNDYIALPVNVDADFRPADLIDDPDR